MSKTKTLESGNHNTNQVKPKQNPQLFFKQKSLQNSIIPRNPIYSQIVHAYTYLYLQECSGTCVSAALRRSQPSRNQRLCWKRWESTGRGGGESYCRRWVGDGSCGRIAARGPTSSSTSSLGRWTPRRLDRTGTMPGPASTRLPPSSDPPDSLALWLCVLGGGLCLWSLTLCAVLLKSPAGQGYS